MKAVLAALTLCLSMTALADDAVQDLWQAKCAGCHGQTGHADTKLGKKENIPDFTIAQFQKHSSDEQLREVITEGSKKNPKMKAYKDRLTPAQIDELVKYIRTLEIHGRADKQPSMTERK